MSYLHIKGGLPLVGSVRLGGAKNASFKLMIAALLAQGESRLLNFSRISDVEAVAQIINGLGGKVRKAGERALFINPDTLNQFEIDDNKKGSQGRFSTIFIPVLLHRFGQAKVPAPGGDKIGKRPLDRHFAGLEALGAKVSYADGYYLASTKGLKGTTYRFAKNTHTGTETLILAAVLAQGKTILENAALEPEIDDLITYLNQMGAKIRRQPNRVIEIDGVKKLKGTIHRIISDRNEAVSYACTALATKGDVVIENANPTHLKAFLEAVEQAGGGYEIGDYGIRFYYKQPLKATQITTQIEPGFMTDWQPLWGTLMTQAEGTSTIHETIMQDRFAYIQELKQMGARIEKFQPKVKNPDELYNFNLENDTPNAKHAIRIYGPTQLKPGKFKVRDLRHGASLVMAALVANGVSTIYNLEQIDRGYEDLAGRLRTLGAQIKRVDI